MNEKLILPFTVVFTLLSSACVPLSEVNPTQAAVDPNAVATIVAGTLASVVGSSEITPTTPTSELRVVYADNTNGFRGGNLWIVENQSPPRQLTSSGLDTSPFLSSDGKLVAFARTVDPNISTVELWAINTDGSHERSLVTSEWLLNVKPGEETTPFKVDWVPGTHLLAFNTRTASEFPGLVSHDNLYVIDADRGELSTILPPGSGAAGFYYSPDGTKIALSSGRGIGLVNADGTGLKELVPHQAPGLGEGSYFAPIDWSPDGTYMRALLTSGGFPGPISGELWHFPADGSPANLLASLPADIILNSPEIRFYAPDLQHIAFVRSVGEPGAFGRELHIADGNGSGDSLYISTPSLQWWGWAVDSRRFVYEDADVAYLGEIGASPRPLFTDATEIRWPKWTDHDQIVFLVGTAGAWQLRLGTPGGSSTVIATSTGDSIEFDINQ